MYCSVHIQIQLVEEEQIDAIFLPDSKIHLLMFGRIKGFRDSGLRRFICLNQLSFGIEGRCGGVLFVGVNDLTAVVGGKLLFYIRFG